MGENSTGIPFFDWLVRYITAIIPIIIGITAGGFAIFRSYRSSVKKELDEAKDIASEELERSKDELCEEIKNVEHHADIEFAKVWAEVQRMLAIQSTQIGEIAVLKVEQRNAWKSIEEIKSITRATSEKVDELSVKIAAIPGDLLNALRKLP